MPAEILDTDEKQAEIERCLAMLRIADEPEKDQEPTPVPVPAVVEMTDLEEPKVVVEGAKPEPVKVSKSHMQNVIRGVVNITNGALESHLSQMRARNADTPQGYIAGRSS